MIWFLFGGDIRYSVRIHGCLLDDQMDLKKKKIKMLSNQREKVLPTPQKRKNPEFLPKSSNKIENNIS